MLPEFREQWVNNLIIRLVVSLVPAGMVKRIDSLFL